MHARVLKFHVGISHEKIADTCFFFSTRLCPSSSILVIIRKFLGRLWSFLDLVTFKDRSDYKDQCFFLLFFILNGWRFKQVIHPILGILVELFPFNKITLKSRIFVLLSSSQASSVGIKQC